MERIKRMAAQRDELLIDYPHLAQELTSIREEVVAKLPELLAEAQGTLQGKGCQVYLAPTAREVQEILSNLLAGQSRIVRAYSKTLQEIGLDDFLWKKRIQSRKTQLREIIAAYRSKQEGHPLLPLSEATKEEICKGLQEFTGNHKEQNLQNLTKLAQQKIKEAIVASEFGLTGINSIVAENGTIILAEDEGNVRAVSNLPYRHVVVAGIEKLAPTAEKAMTTIQGATIYGLGKKVLTYFSLISGPSRTADIEFRMAYGMHGPKEVHVILLDNGRSQLRDQGLGHLLKCLDCGACYSTCASLAKANKWEGVPLTPKALALAILWGKIDKPGEKSSLSIFSCPVGIKGENLVTDLKAINSI